VLRLFRQSTKTALQYSRLYCNAVLVDCQNTRQAETIAQSLNSKDKNVHFNNRTSPEHSAKKS